MAKRRREPDSDGTATEMAGFNTVFVDTSLDTHLAMLVSSSDTVSDFKKKMALEHKQCFPTIGEIQILSVKVERRSNFYHLPDIMIVWSAFHGVKENWFLTVDVSGAHTCQSTKNPYELDSSNCVKMGITNIDVNCRGSDVATEKNAVSEMIAGFKFENSVEKTTDFHSNICSVENHMRTESRPKKKRKVRNTEDACHYPSSEDARTLFQVTGKDVSIPEVVGGGNLTVDAVRESPGGVILHKQNGKSLSDATADVSVARNDHFEGTSPPTIAEKSNLGSIMTSQNLLSSDEKKEDNVLESKMDCDLAQDAPTKHLECVPINVPDHSARLMDVGGGVGEVNPEGSKRKKKKVQKAARKIQDTIDMGQNGKGERMKPCSETHKSDEKEEDNGLPSGHDHGVIMPLHSKASDHFDPDLPLKEASFSRDADSVMEPEISSGIKKKKKKKKREKKSVNANLEKSGIEQTDNGISGTSGLLLPSTGHNPEETGKEEGITHHEGKGVQLLLDSSTLDAREKVQGVNRNEADSVILTQTEQIAEDVGSGKKMMVKKTQSSAGKCHADIPTVETENPTMECSQVDTGNENTENKDRKTSKKRKKRKLTASEVQEDLPVEDQQVGIEALATKETSISFLNSEQECRHVDSSQALSSKTEEKLNEMHGIAENTDDLAKTSEKEGERINFKQFFLPGQYQDKVDSSEKVKKATKSNQVNETSKRVKDNDLPSVSNSTELQNSVKSFENKKSENKSHRMGSSRIKGLSAQNSDQDEMISNSLRRSSGAPGKGAKDSSPSDMHEATLQKPNDILSASSHVNKKNRSLDKSILERSEILPGKQGNKRLQSGLNVTNMMPMKTPQKKSLFTKSGAIFQDNSGDSSGDENGTMHSDGSTVSPSDSSSMSGDSVRESDLSQDSTRNVTGSNDAEGRSAGRRNMSKLDLSASKNLTMDEILRSSKRFKKAKLAASQNEDEQNEGQPIEFVPDSQFS